MFDDADAYERFMGRWSAVLAPRFLDAVFGEAGPPEAVCDVGCGTGNLGAEVLARAPGCRVTGVDPAPAFVEAARERLGPGARVVQGSAGELPLEDGEVGAALALLVLNFVPDPAAAVGDMARVTHGGGVVAAAVWDYGGGMAMLRTYWDAAAAVHPDAAAVDEALARPARAGGLEALFDAARLDDRVGGVLEVPMRFASFADYWDPFLLGIGPAGDFTRALDGEGRDALRAELERRLGSGPVEMTSSARWVAARVPG